ncbi:Myb-like DNA-binding protein [Nitzschia inconspicua]|uniref:Myb-like DNA-binding protein n=1 Tax=Nitzschia inconspicua TaxID=303405 RepID=A0A9K3L1F4_9STRA|nr:Myb-like DNA-binding protein [Nitzschia inconspicua]
MSDHRNTGKWSEEEKVVFEQGIAEFGLDWKKMEEHLGGARNLNQIRHYYRTMREKEPDMFSPEKIGTKTPKKRSSTAAGNSTTTPKKKTKAGEADSKTPTKRIPKKAPASAAKVSAVAVTRRTPKKSAPEESLEGGDEFDEMPPPLPTVSVDKVAPKKEATAAPRKSSSVDSGVMTTEEKVEGSTPLKFVTDFLQKEEVQTVLAGILGFVVVFVAKKFMN